MLYRIRYRNADSTPELETTVEAGSPTEAVVKFRCTRGGDWLADAARGHVTSVQCMQESAEAIWW